jgi:desulfoferrodoxin-like iron-binding protein
MKNRINLKILSVLMTIAFIIIPTGCAKKELTGEKAQTSEKVQIAEDLVEETIFTKTVPGVWAGKEEGHVPQIVFNKVETGLTVTVTVNHEMNPDQPHFIMWVKLKDSENNLLGEKNFQPDDEKAQAVFELTSAPSKLIALEKCNLHGLWMEEVEIKQE